MVERHEVTAEPMDVIVLVTGGAVIVKTRVPVVTKFVFVTETVTDVVVEIVLTPIPRYLEFRAIVSEQCFHGTISVYQLVEIDVRLTISCGVTGCQEFLEKDHDTTQKTLQGATNLPFLVVWHHFCSRHSASNSERA